MARLLRALTAVLFAIALLDELTSGVPSINAAQIERGFHLSHAMTAFALFVVPGVIAMLVEPVIFLYADRYPRAWFVRGGIAAMAISSIACALAPTAIALSLAMSGLWIAIGTAASLSQATLVDSRPDARGQVMARWTLLATLGDLAAPIAVGALAALGYGWRAGFAAVGVVLALAFVVVVRAPFEAAAKEPEEETLPLFAAFKLALTDRTLVAWLFVTQMCDLLDEILVVFATIHMKVHYAASAESMSAMVGAMTVGGIGGLVVLERLLPKIGEKQMLRVTAIGCAIVFVAWVLVPQLGAPVVTSIALMVPVGAFVAPLYPLCAAQAFARRPEASGSVLAAGHLFTPLGLALPFVVGLIADRVSTTVALFALLAQPLVILVFANRAAPSPSSSDP